MLKIADKILAGEKPTLCFFGDSVTHGEFEFTNGHKESVVRPELVYHKLLADQITDRYGKEICVVNAGIGGNFSSDGLARIQRDVLDRKPDFCCVMFGTNDVTNARKGEAALEGYKSNIRKILDMLRQQGIEAVVMTPGMLCSRGVKGFGGFWWFVHKYYENLQKNGSMDAYVEALRQVAREKNAPIADAYAQWKAMEENGVDTTALLCNGMNHPNGEMHKLFADVLMEAIFGQKE